MNKKGVRDWALEKRHAAVASDCRLCAQVPEEEREWMRQQLREARRIRIGVELVLVWLKEECGISLTHEDYISHQRGKHWK